MRSANFIVRSVEFSKFHSEIRNFYSEKSRNSTQKRLFIAYFQWLHTLFVYLLSNQSKNCPEAKKTSKNHLYLIKLSWKYIIFFSIRALAKKLDFFRKFSKSWKNLEKNLRFFLLKIIWKIKNFENFEISKNRKFLIFNMIFNRKNLRFFRNCRSEIFLFTKEEVPFVNLVLQGGVPMPQTPFLGVLGLSYVQQSCLEGHAGPKPASSG